MCCVGCVFPCRLYSDRHFNVLLSLKSTHASSERTFQIRSVGQNPIYTVYIYTVFWQGNHRIYGHIRCIYTVLANPTDMLQISQASWLSVSLANVLCACVAVLSVPVRGPPLAKTASVLTYIYNEVCVCVCNVMLGLLFNSFVVAHPFAFISHWLTLLCTRVVAMSRVRLLFIPSICFHFSSLAHPSLRTGGGHVSCQAGPVHCRPAVALCQLLRAAASVQVSGVSSLFCSPLFHVPPYTPSTTTGAPHVTESIRYGWFDSTKDCICREWPAAKGHHESAGWPMYPF